MGIPIFTFVFKSPNFWGVMWAGRPSNWSSFLIEHLACICFESPNDLAFVSHFNSVRFDKFVLTFFVKILIFPYKAISTIISVFAEAKTTAWIHSALCTLHCDILLKSILESLRPSRRQSLFVWLFFLWGSAWLMPRQTNSFSVKIELLWTALYGSWKRHNT